MQSFNIQYKSIEDLIKAKSTLKNFVPHNLLIQVFTGQPDDHFIKSLLDELLEIFPTSSILGTTTAGEIFNGDSIDKSTIISFTQFDEVSVKTALIRQNDELFEGGRQMGEQLVSPTTKLAILFGCGIKDNGAINGEPLLQGFQKSCPEVIVVGGQAGDNGLAQNTYVFTENGYTNQGAACAALEGEGLRVDNRYNLSWVPLGKQMFITEAEKTCIKTIDDQPAKDVYSHYLGENVGSRLPHSAAEYPLVVERNGVMLARHANKVLDDGSLEFMAPFYTGEKVRFAFCHSGLVLESAKHLYEDLKKKKHGAIFVYSCLSRKWVLGQDANLEIAPLASLAPTAGFFCYGEYYNNNKKNMFLSQTMTVIAISEDCDHKKDEVSVSAEYDFHESETKQVHDLQALHRLVETSAQERETLIKELKIALAEIKTLQGFIPICAKCKNIRDDKGYWNGIEDYISRHTEAQFSHGLCPACAEELYPDLYKKIQEEERKKELEQMKAQRDN